MSEQGSSKGGRGGSGGRRLNKFRGPVVSPLADEPAPSTHDHYVVDGKAGEWHELFANGISVSSNLGRPVLVLKDKYGVEILPVWMNPLDAGVALTELSPNASGSTPHSAVRRMMQTLGIRADRCFFVELTGHHQYIVITFRGDDRLQGIRLRAEEAMSFCIQSRARFFATKDFMHKCRAVDGDMERVENGLQQEILQGLHTEHEISSKKHPYMM